MLFYNKEILLDTKMKEKMNYEEHIEKVREQISSGAEVVTCIPGNCCVAMYRTFIEDMIKHGTKAVWVDTCASDWDVAEEAGIYVPRLVLPRWNSPPDRPMVEFGWYNFDPAQDEGSLNFIRRSQIERIRAIHTLDDLSRVMARQAIFTNRCYDSEKRLKEFDNLYKK